MNIDEQRPERWITFQGKEVKPNEIDQQHLSNLYWFHLIFWGKKLMWSLDEIVNRFNGQLLPYRPHTHFKAEIQELEERGLLIWDKDEFLSNEFVKKGKIWFKGVEIGEIQFARN